MANQEAMLAGGLGADRTAAAIQVPTIASPSESPWIVAIAVMLATFMEVLDTAIASVALPYIAGSLSASTDEATWVLTSYLVANAIVLPASNWFAMRIGRKRFFIICVAIFTASSFACGAAPTLGFILLARVLQGAGGGALQPRRIRFEDDAPPPGPGRSGASGARSLNLRRPGPARCSEA